MADPVTVKVHKRRSAVVTPFPFLCASAGADFDRCCLDLTRLLSLRNDPSLPQARRNAIAQQVIALCDCIEASLAQG